jgi:hypothetical protein
MEYTRVSKSYFIPYQQRDFDGSELYTKYLKNKVISFICSHG